MIKKTKSDPRRVIVESVLWGASLDGEANVHVLTDRILTALDEANQVPDMRDALEAIVSQGEPLRGDAELWSTWQTRVNAWKSARAALAKAGKPTEETKPCDLTK